MTEDTAGYQTVRIKIKDVSVDQAYQRERQDRHVQHMVGNWAPEQFRPPLVSMREDGTYWSVDGQQRLAAAQALGFEYVWAIVVPSKGSSAEAALFALANTDSKRVAGQVLHRALAHAGHPVSVRIEKVLSEFNLTAKPNSAIEVRAIAQLRSCWVNWEDPTPEAMESGAETLRWAVYVLSGQLANHPSREVYRGEVLGGLIWLHKNAPEPLNTAAIKARLTAVAPAFTRFVSAGHRISSGKLSRHYALNIGRWLDIEWVEGLTDDSETVVLEVTA